MIYEWDETKRQANIAKHGIDFTVIEAFDWSTASVTVDARHDERRLVALGHLNGRLHVAVYTIREGRRRIISVRKANAREEKRYVQQRGSE